MKLGIRSKLFLVSLLLITISVAVADVYLTNSLDAAMTERAQRDLVVRLALIERDASTASLQLDDIGGWDALADELGRRGQGRVTLARADGLVLGDSEVDKSDLAALENHANRPEMRMALQEGLGASTRFSDTLQRRMLYVAVPFSRGGSPVGVARLAMPLTEVDHAIAQLRRMVYLASALALALAIVMSSLAAHWVSQSVRSLTAAARRLADGDLDARTRVAGTDEVAELGKALDQLAANLKTALGELRSERDRMGRVLDSMREGVLLLDKESRVQLANPALREILLLGRDIVGKTPLEVVRNADLKRILDHAAESREPASGEVELGELKPRQLLVQATRLADEHGGMLVVFVDVTDLRRLESMRSDFVANVSHELRTPITAIRSAAETLRRAVETRPEAAADFIDMIERNASRLHRLVEDLLDLSRIEAREFRLNLEPVSVEATATHVLLLLGTSADQKSMRLELSVPEDLPPLLADRRALEQVLANLIENAVKYGPERGLVQVRAERVGTGVRVSVEDDGPGVEAAHLPRLFERFYRVDAGRSRDVGGTGLGLAIVKHLVEAMGGTVDVTSAPGKGSTFSFELPQS